MTRTAEGIETHWRRIFAATHGRLSQCSICDMRLPASRAFHKPKCVFSLRQADDARRIGREDSLTSLHKSWSVATAPMP